QTLQGPRVFIRSKATCATPPCEVLTPCRGLRPHHIASEAGRSRVWPSVSSGCRVRWSASGRRGAEADDARAREVGPRHSSFEAGEQSGAIRRGVGAAKDGDQGECGPAKHALDSAPGSRVTGAGPHTACLCRHTPEVGAVCGKAARTVL